MPTIMPPIIKQSLQQWFAYRNSITLRESRRMINFLRKEDTVFTSLMELYLEYFNPALA